MCLLIADELSFKPHAVFVKVGKSMLKTLAPCALLLFALLQASSAAEPIKLKMAYFSSDRTTTYLAAIGPFVDAVNAEVRGPCTD